jgi:hypothetical protein
MFELDNTIVRQHSGCRIPKHYMDNRTVLHLVQADELNCMRYTGFSGGK